LSDLDKIADFIQKYNPTYKDRDSLIEYLKQHFEYKTAFVMYDNDKIVAVCRWNINGEVADILDLYIHEDYRRHRIIQQMLFKGHWMFPQAKFIRFERQVKYPDREHSVIPIDKILKRSK
jgi:N-acetylglutamate synthase-like GNAT family acetyltransferase